jgi:hypothetical protein
VAAHVAGRSLHRAAAEPTPGEGKGAQDVHAGNPPPEAPDTRGVPAVGGARRAAICPRMVRRLGLGGSDVRLQGTSRLDEATPALLPVAAGGRRRDRELVNRGVSRDLAWDTVKSAQGPWRLRRRPALTCA